MPLPEKVIEQLGREPAKTPGWAAGALMFSGGVLFIMILIYVGLTFGYEPYLNNQVTSVQDQVNQLGQSIPASDQANLLDFYSQVSNLRTLLRAHVLSSQLFTWLETNTEANVFYKQLTFGSNNQLTLSGNGKTEADVNQQIAIFEASPMVQKVNVTTVGTSQDGTGIDFGVTLIIAPSLLSNPILNAAAPTSTASTASTTAQ